MLVLGIDPGTAITGYGLVRENPDGSLRAVAQGAVTTQAGVPMPDRLVILHEELRAILEAHSPDSCAVEKLFFSKNAKTAMTVSQARGVILLTLAQAKLPIAEYAPVEIKQAVAGYGGADKRQIQEMVRVLLNLQAIPKPDDAADALAVAICHIHSAKLTGLAAEQKT